VLKKYPYPIIAGEKHIRPTMILMRLSLDYKVRFINVPLQINRHAPDGITANRFAYRMRNPKGLRLCFFEYITLFSDYFGVRKLLRYHIRYVRYSLHSGIGFTEQRREVKHFFLWLAALPAGVLKWIRDKHRKRVQGI
jgi:hypothetical protein